MKKIVKGEYVHNKEIDDVLFLLSWKKTEEKFFSVLLLKNTTERNHV